MTGNEFTYQELLKKFGVRLFDTMGDPREFTPFQLANGWQWWADQPFNREGYVCEIATGNLYRLTSRVEIRGRLKFRIYIIGTEIESDQENCTSFPAKK